MKVHGHPFMILTLEPEGAQYSGTLVHPRQMNTDGRNFSAISADTISERVTTEAPKAQTVRITASDPANPKDVKVFDLTLTGPDEAQLKIAGGPISAWPVTRYDGSGAPRVWTGWDARRSYPLEDEFVDQSAEMAEIYKADQAVRQSMESFRANAKQIAKEDAARRARVRQLLAKDELKAAEDFRLAAMVFQHGSEPRDYLFAHTLSLVALVKGDRSAAWIASATLDRYLNSIGQPQIFGSQFGFDGKPQGAVDGDLVSDALRRQLGVPALADQQAQIERMLKQQP